MESFANCLKAFRRGVYVADGGYNCLVICSKGSQLEFAFDEAARTLNASSLGVEAINYATRKIHTERGGMIAFKVKDVQPDTLKGMEWPHIITLCGDLPERLDTVLRVQNRSHNEAVTPKWQEASL